MWAPCGGHRLGTKDGVLQWASPATRSLVLATESLAGHGVTRWGGGGRRAQTLEDGVFLLLGVADPMQSRMPGQRNQR